MLSAFLCPGVGQWVAGRRALGAAIVVAAVLSAGAPFAFFFWGLFQPHDCGDLLKSNGDVLGFTMHCSWIGVRDALHAAALAAAIGFPSFAALWIGSVVHASRLTIPATPGGAAPPPGPPKS